MRSELRCEEARLEISARLDGEIDAATDHDLQRHLATCAACRQHEEQLRRVTRAVRLQEAEKVPDLTESIMAAIAAEQPAARRSDIWRVRTRIALVAAMIGALVTAGSVVPFQSDGVDVASASDISRLVRTAATELGRYHATFRIEERGWHPEVETRRFDAEIWFAAPERLRLRVRDETDYPGDRWPANDVDLVADESSWWIREPSACPAPALPACSIKAGTEIRSLTHRQPFDGTSSVPTDIVLPLETVASHEGIEVIAHEEIAGHGSYHIALPYWQAVPLVGSLQAGGSWRSFDALDRVDLWLDDETWFPLRFTIAPASGGDVALDVRATSFDQPASFPAGTFDAPVSGIARDGGFHAEPVPSKLVPRYTAGMRPYRTGTTPQGQEVTTFARGMAWLKVIVEGPRRPSFAAASAELVRVGPGFGLYQPATEQLRRRIDLFSRDGHIHLESNLARSELLDVGASIPARGRKIDELHEGRSSVVTRISFDDAEALDFARSASYLPSGYRPSAAFISRSTHGSRLTMFYRRAQAEFDGFGIRVTQAPGMSSLPASSENFLNVTIGELRARWSSQRSELEWIDDGAYRAVAVPAFDLSVAVQIAGGLR